ncbi:phage portal protein [Tropicibacter sp. R16_0]|uniref:phage portal protein n=1 Tax=Tropicibacter sp. R16_0 TaxID=2821102 RepID=UPI001ADAC499|nr:phage portal protein [Tropicibacter sp. R16_0]MBO9451453.1 phage portal protein [Tropicibacter sp. R16_0]
MRDAVFGATAPYVAGDLAVDTMQGFQPSRMAPDAEIGQGRDKITARARDLARNNGWAAGAVSKEVDSIIGGNFRPFCKPDWRALGLDPVWAQEFKEEVQAKWRNYAEDPRKLADTTRSQTVSQLFGTAYRGYLIEGEALGLVNWRRKRPTHTCLRLVDPDLLSNPYDHPDTPFLRGGINLSRDGVALAYNFRQSHPNTNHTGFDSLDWKRIRRELPTGRPQVIHFFDKLRDGQTRGVSRMAPIIERLRMEDHYSKVELQAAVINAVLAAFIKSPMGPEAMDDMFGGDTEAASAFLGMQAERGKFYDKNKIRLGGSQVTMLYPNDEIGMVQTARPAAQFAEFEAAVLRNIASGLGISYEQLASDWSKTNYSSARAAMIEIWRGWTNRRIAFAQNFCQPFFMAWLEEMVIDGHIKLPSRAPDFYENWVAYTRAKWIGPGKGFVDPVKEAQASAMRVALGMSTLEEEAAELTGSDFGDNIVQIKAEIEMMPDNVLHPMQESFAKLLGHNAGPVMSPED